MKAADPLLTVKELAAYLNVTVGTIYRWRTEHRGPRGIRVGRWTMFRQSDVDAWLEVQADALPMR